MTKVYVENYGCKANHDDGNIMKGILKRDNFDVVDNEYEADVVVVNTCIVKQTTANKIRNRLSKLKLKLSPLIKLETPFDFFDYNNLQMNALCVLSDSGSVPEESAIFKFRAVQIRISSERPEAFDSGTIILTGFNKNTIVNSVELVVNQKISDEGLEIPEGYKSKNVSIKVVKLIMGLASIRKYHKT